jgi:hypothetical protein
VYGNIRDYREIRGERVGGTQKMLIFLSARKADLKKDFQHLVVVVVVVVLLLLWTRANSGSPGCSG